MEYASTYSARITSLEEKIKKNNALNKELRLLRKKELTTLRDCMKHYRLEQVGKWNKEKIEKIIDPPPRKKRDTKKDKDQRRLRALEILQKIGVPNANKLYSEISGER